MANGEERMTNEVGQGHYGANHTCALSCTKAEDRVGFRIMIHQTALCPSIAHRDAYIEAG